MSWRLAAQSCGSFIVVASFAASEAAARYLSARPGSALAWYFNLEVFRPFELARSSMSPLRGMFSPASLWIALVLIGVIAVLHVRRLRWGIALMTNLSFLFTLFLAATWAGWPGGTRGASLAGVAREAGGDRVLIASLLLGSSLSMALSHVSLVARAADDLLERCLGGAVHRQPNPDDRRT